MLSLTAAVLVPAFGALHVTADPGAVLAPGSIVAANHTALADPAIVLAALQRLDTRPVVLAAAGLWRVPVLGRALRSGGHIPVHRGTARAAEALDRAAEALAAGRLVLIYGEEACRGAVTPVSGRPARSAAVWPGSRRPPVRRSSRSARPVPAGSSRVAY